jgi:hypothetical protein
VTPPRSSERTRARAATIEQLMRDAEIRRRTSHEALPTDTRPLVDPRRLHTQAPGVPALRAAHATAEAVAAIPLLCRQDGDTMVRLRSMTSQLFRGARASAIGRAIRVGYPARRVKSVTPGRALGKQGMASPLALSRRGLRNRPARRMRYPVGVRWPADRSTSLLVGAGEVPPQRPGWLDEAYGGAGREGMDDCPGYI